jgi:hypothetical protein
MDRNMTKQFIFTEVDGLREWGFTIKNPFLYSMANQDVPQELQ